MSKDIKTFNHGTGPIRITSNLDRLVIEGKPIELHLKEDGTLSNGPSLAIIVETINGNKVVAQVSLEMLNEALNELGYKIVSS